MLNLSSRIAEYAITGGFFICAQLLMFVLAHPDAATFELFGIINNLSPQIDALPSALQPAISSLLVALALLSVFFFGLLLDLIGGSLSFAYDIRIFRKHIENNDIWITKLLDITFHDYTCKDFASIVAGVKTTTLRSLLLSFCFWKRSVWQDGIRQPLVYFRLRPVLQRIEQLLFSYALETQSVSKINWLGEQLRLCRMSRAVSLTLLLVGMEATWIAFSRLPMILFSSRLPLILVEYGAFGLSIFLTSRAYSRFLATLFCDRVLTGAIGSRPARERGEVGSTDITK